MRRSRSETTVRSSKEAVRRPDVGWQHGLARLLMIFAAGVAASDLIIESVPATLIPRQLLTELCIMSAALITARGNILLAIRLYQRYAPEHVRRRCAMTPSCSEYAVSAIRRHGILKGSLMTYRRLRYRCDGTPITDYP